jgi:Short-chain dehydrogenases of various substrate specificities
MSTQLPKVLITGASTGIGATYADRFAHRGHDLVLVARDEARMRALAERLEQQTRVGIDILKADLTAPADLARVESRVHEDERIGVLVNNAGIATHGSFANPDLDDIERLLRLNVTALTRLVGAIVPRYLRQGGGAIINVASVLALAPEFPLGAYGATKSYVLALSQNLQSELGPRGIYVQAVLPAGTRTEIWERSGRDTKGLGAMMDVNEMVDAALVGFDRREAVTLPSLPNVDQWQAFDAARRAMLPNFANVHPADRYSKEASGR